MTTSPNILIQTDLVYAEGARPLSWDVYSPAEPSTERPVVLLLHGGGLRVGDRSAMTAAATAFAECGFVAIASEYRLLGEVSWPQPLNDVRSAIRAVRAQAGFLAVNPDQLFVVGFSAGGFLALMAAGAPTASFPGDFRPHGDMSEALAGVAAFFPVAKASPTFAESLGVSMDQIDSISPMTYVSGLPPTIIFSGDADPITPVSHVVELYDAIKSAGGVADLRLYSNLVHEFVSLPGMLTLTTRDAVEFFKRTAINNAAFDKALEDLKKWWADILARPPG